MPICVHSLYGWCKQTKCLCNWLFAIKVLFISTDVVCFYTHQNRAYNDLIYVCLEGHVDKGSCPTSHENILGSPSEARHNDCKESWIAEGKKRRLHLDSR